MKLRFFITATGTDIGKTFITAALAQQAKLLGHSVMAYKPVVSGFDPAKPEDGDTVALLRALDLPPTAQNIERLSPWRFLAPLAPTMAARREGKKLDFDAVVNWSRKAISSPEDIIMIEGVGGVMVPMDEKHTIADWIAATGLPALLVTGSYLGTISHTLTALAVLEQRDIPVSALIVNESENSSVGLDETVEEFRQWTKIPVLQVKRREKDGWQDVEELRTLLTQTRHSRESGNPARAIASI